MWPKWRIARKLQRRQGHAPAKVFIEVSFANCIGYFPVEDPDQLENALLLSFARNLASLRRLLVNVHKVGIMIKQFEYKTPSSYP